MGFRLRNIVSGAFTPVLAKHTESFNLVDTLSVGVDRIQRNFEPLQRQVGTWRQTQIIDAIAKLILYSAFIDGRLEAPKSLLPDVRRLYLEPQYPEFAARTMSASVGLHCLTNGVANEFSLDWLSSSFHFPQRRCNRLARRAHGFNRYCTLGRDPISRARSHNQA
jgi:hypothetical protein